MVRVKVGYSLTGALLCNAVQLKPWQKAETAEGRKYFCNKETGESSWTIPEELVNTEKWEVKFNEEHKRPYYINKADRSSAWEIPDEDLVFDAPADDTEKEKVDDAETTNGAEETDAAKDEKPAPRKSGGMRAPRKSNQERISGSKAGSSSTAKKEKVKTGAPPPPTAAPPKPPTQKETETSSETVDSPSQLSVKAKRKSIAQQLAQRDEKAKAPLTKQKSKQGGAMPPPPSHAVVKENLNPPKKEVKKNVADDIPPAPTSLPPPAPTQETKTEETSAQPPPVQQAPPAVQQQSSVSQTITKQKRESYSGSVLDMTLEHSELHYYKYDDGSDLKSNKGIKKGGYAFRIRKREKVRKKSIIGSSEVWNKDNYIDRKVQFLPALKTERVKMTREQEAYRPHMKKRVEMLIESNKFGGEALQDMKEFLENIDDFKIELSDNTRKSSLRVKKHTWVELVGPKE